MIIYHIFSLYKMCKRALCEAFGAWLIVNIFITLLYFTVSNDVLKPYLSAPLSCNITILKYNTFFSNKCCRLIVSNAYEGQSIQMNRFYKHDIIDVADGPTCINETNVECYYHNGNFATYEYVKKAIYIVHNFIFGAAEVILIGSLIFWYFYRTRNYDDEDEREILEENYDDTIDDHRD
jgi:hypothetical protein